MSETAEVTQVKKAQTKKTDAEVVDPTQRVLGSNIPEELTAPLDAELQQQLLQRSSDASFNLEDLEGLSRAEQIAFMQKHIGNVQGSLKILLNSMAENPSYLSAWARLWGDLSQWKKWLGGTLVTALPITVAIAAHLPVLFGVGGAMAVIFGTTNFLLEDHFRSSQFFLQKIKERVLSLADILVWTITILHDLAKVLETQVNKFKEENAKLKSENERLTDNVDKLCRSVDVLSRNIKIKLDECQMISNIKEELAINIQQLSHRLDSQTLDAEARIQHLEALEESQSKLALIEEAYSSITEQMHSQISQLAKEKSELAHEVANLKQMGQVLSATIQEMSKTVIGDASEREQFQQRLDRFITDKEESFAELTAKASETGKKLIHTQEELESTKEALKETQLRLQSVLLDHQNIVLAHQNVLTRLEQLEQRASAKILPQTERESVVTTAVKTFFGQSGKDETSQVHQDQRKTISVA